MSTATVQPGRRAIAATPEYRGAPPDTRTPRRRGGGKVRYLRRQAKPWKVMGGLLLAAAAAKLAVLLTGDAAAVALVIAVVAATATIVASIVIGARRGAVPVARFFVRAVVACVWLTWAAAAGASVLAFAVWAAVGFGLSAGHWRQNRIENPGEPRPAPPPPVATEAKPPRLWENHVGCQGGSLPGSRLTGEDPTSTGRRYDCHLVPGRQTLAGAKAEISKLRTGVRLLPGQDLILEAHPELDESIIRVTIVEKSEVLTKDHIPWPGPTFDPRTGTVALGPYVDGEDVARWIILADNGLYGGYLCGATRSGKSRMLESIALAAADAGMVVWFADPQGGASSPWLANHADHVARNVAQAKQMLAEARAVKDLRQGENAYYDLEGFKHSPERPGLIIIIDECHRVFEDLDAQKIATELAREGSKVGIAIVAASQVATLDAFGTGGGADALRSSITAGNLVVLRTKSNNTKAVLPGVDVDPTLFPRIAGYGYLVDDTGKRRTAPLRGYYLSDEARAAWDSQVKWRSLDNAAAAAAGNMYLHRDMYARQARAALAGRIDAMRNGAAAQPPDPHQRPAPTPTSTEDGSPSRNSITVPFTGKVIQFPDVAETLRKLGQPAPAAANTPGTPVLTRTKAGDVVYALVCNGVTKTGEIQRRSGYSEAQTRRTLNELKDAGMVANPVHGEWVRAS